MNKIAKSAMMFGCDPSDERVQQFAAHLIFERRRAKLNQTQVALEVGITQPHFSNIETARHEPSPQLVFAFEKCLGLPPGTLSRFLGYVPVEKEDN